MPAQGCWVILVNFHGGRTCFTPNLHFLQVICLLLRVLTLQTQSWPRAPVATCCLRTSALLGPPSLATGGGLGNTVAGEVRAGWCRTVLRHPGVAYPPTLKESTPSGQGCRKLLDTIKPGYKVLVTFRDAERSTEVLVRPMGSNPGH